MPAEPIDIDHEGQSLDRDHTSGLSSTPDPDFVNAYPRTFHQIVARSFDDVS